MQNPFSDLIPRNSQSQQQQANPFSDLIPQGNASRVTQIPNEGRGFFNDLGRRGLAIAGSAAKNTIKDFIPSALNMFAPGSGDVMAKTTPISGAGKNVDFYKELGVDKGLGSSILQEGLEFAPYMIGAKSATAAAKAIPRAAEMLSKLRGKYPKSTRIGTEVAENSLAGGVQAANKDESVGLGAVLGGFSVPAGYAIAAPFKAGAKALAQSSIPGMTERATKKLKDLLTPEGYASKLYQIFSTKSGKNDINWKSVDSIAGKLDESLGSLKGKSTELNFDNAPYLNHIDSFLSRVKGLEPAKKTEYEQAIEFATRAKELAPESFGGAIKLRQLINQELKDYLGQKGVPSANRQSKEFIKGLKNNLSGETITLNAKKIGEGAEKEFGSAWEKANKSHGELQNFYKLPNKLGTEEEKKAFRAAMKDPSAEDGAIIGQFMPKPEETGTQKLRHLEKLFGSRKDAQDAAKSYLNKRPLNNGNTVLDASTEYAKLSPQQRSWIYGDSKDGQILKTINDIRKSYGKEPERSFYKMFSHPASSLVMPAMAGSAAGYYGGEGKGAAGGAAAALAATMLAKKGAGKLSPDRVRKMLIYSKARASNPGRYINPLFQSLMNSGGEEQ